MGAQLRVYRSRIKAVQGTKKITRAFELIAASRMVKAQQRTAASAPYARAITRAVSAVATYSNEDHPLTTEKREVTRAAMLLVTSDRGLAGAYSSNVIKEGERLAELLRGEGKEVVPFIAGRKGSSYYRFRRRTVAAEWVGFSDAPQFENAKEIADALIEAFLRPTEEGGVDEIHIVSTRFVNMVTQTPEVVRLLPLEVVEGDEPPAPDDVLPLYEFEPSAAAVLDALLPRYVESRIFNALLQSAASELAARQRAMKSATDNAEELIKRYTRLANTARQSEITQEISEIVGGANALADASASA
ncbi:F0F1 ATP synthase subunit gamma [Kineosporia sp. A_224]|uniref:F0F1 ATP synthase subunit gamma n=1 Tax=Kineosporia sp. A_224 TaxID=1962180 RepID=UPI000B4AFA6A|nr:F0F1 ATP synthase subunit gamma [Kineosporia sp. A_224]